MFYSFLEKWHLIPEVINSKHIKPIAAFALGKTPISLNSMQLIQINREKGAEDRRVCIFLKSSQAYSHAFNPHILEYPINATGIIIFNS